MATIVRVSLLLALCAGGLYAQFWESTGGPGGSGLWGAIMCPNGDIYTLSEGIFRSKDNGYTWERVGREIPFSGNARQIQHTPSGTICVLTNGELWRSQDDGQSWTKLHTFVSPSYMAVAPSGQLTISSHASIYHSLDEGTTWSSTYSLPAYLKGSVAIDHDGIMYMGSPYYLYFRSADNGASWWQIFSGLPQRGPYWFRSAGNSVVFAGVGNALYVSTDSGRVWKDMGVPSGGSSIKSVLYTNKDTILVLHEKGVSKTTDGGNQWKPYTEDYPSFTNTLLGSEENLFLLTYYDLYKHSLPGWKKVSIPFGKVSTLAASKSGHVVAATSISQGSGTMRVWARTESLVWQECSVMESNGVKALGADSAGAMFMITGDAYLKYSSDPLSTWETSGSRSFGSQMAFSKNLLYLASGGVYRSSDKGSTWDKMKNGITDTVLTAVASAEPGPVYAGGMTKFYRSTDFGSTWEEPTLPFIIGSGKISAIVAHDSVVIVAVDRTGVYFSSDYGTLWKNHSQGIVGDTVFSLVNTPSGALFIAASTGVYEYQSSSKTWLNVNQNISKVTCLALGSDGKVYAGTNGDGVWRTTKSYGSWTRDVTELRVAEQGVSIYPNPAAATITVNLGDAEPGDFTISIYDVLGVCRLVSTNEQTLNISALANGQYVVRIKVGDILETQLMTVIH